LTYLQEIYGPPLSLSGFCGKNIDCFTPKEDIKNPKKSTWFSGETRPDDYRTGIVCKNLPSIPKKGVIKGFKTQLTVYVPKHCNHSFWKQTRRDESPCKASEWISFQVERTGPTKEDSHYCAVQQARNIIVCIRTALESGKPIPCLKVRPISPLLSLYCPVLRLGQILKDRWKSNSQSSSGQCSGNIDFLNEVLQTKFESELPIQIRFLIQYYQVCLYHAYNVDLRRFSTCRWESLTTQPVYSATYLFSYLVNLKNHHSEKNLQEQFMTDFSGSGIYLNLKKEKRQWSRNSVRRYISILALCLFQMDFAFKLRQAPFGRGPQVILHEIFIDDGGRSGTGEDGD
jgi:hypothetical protein